MNLNNLDLLHSHCKSHNFSFVRHRKFQKEDEDIGSHEEEDGAQGPYNEQLDIF